jgi:hypothetical protein
MRTRVNAGPEPMRLRLEMLDADELATALREMILRAQTGSGQLTRSARRVIEAVQIAHDAIRARERLAQRKPIPARWLAALGNVATSRVRQLIREQTLRRKERGIDPSSAEQWLKGGAIRGFRARRLVLTAPSWWSNCLNKTYEFYEVREGIQRLLPAECELQLDVAFNPCFEVPATSQLDDETIEVLRATVRQAFEAHTPMTGRGARAAPSTGDARSSLASRDRHVPS